MGWIAWRRWTPLSALLIPARSPARRTNCGWVSRPSQRRSSSLRSDLVRDCCCALDAAEFAARRSAATLSDRLRVQATAAFVHLHVIPHLPRFLAQHPALDVDLRIDD